MEAGSGERAQRGTVGAPIKPPDSNPISETWLRDFDKDRSEYLQRLETDRSIIDELRAAGFAGAHYTYFASELSKYGIAVMTAWIRTQQIFTKMKQRGMGGLRRPPTDILNDQEVAAELACETVAYAIHNFRLHVLIPGKWDPNKGASIRTYFIGQCLIQFANVYRRWLSETFDEPPWKTLVNEAAMTARGYEHVETRVEQLVQVDQVLASVKKPRTKEMLVLSSTGLTHAQIAARMGITPKTVEMTLANERKRQTKERRS
ncbi:sigma-70 RNA polymerase sigma factor region 4 domain-containing protein [Humibacter ginsengisoli]